MGLIRCTRIRITLIRIFDSRFGQIDPEATDRFGTVGQNPRPVPHPTREVENATIAMIICDRGDRYLSTGVYDKP